MNGNDDNDNNMSSTTERTYIYTYSSTTRHCRAISIEDIEQQRLQELKTHTINGNKRQRRGFNENMDHRCLHSFLTLSSSKNLCSAAPLSSCFVYTVPLQARKHTATLCSLSYQLRFNPLTPPAPSSPHFTPPLTLLSLVRSFSSSSSSSSSS